MALEPLTPMRPAMKIFSWNVNGIRAVLKKGLFQPFLDHLYRFVLG